MMLGADVAHHAYNLSIVIVYSLLLQPKKWAITQHCALGSPVTCNALANVHADAKSTNA